MIVKTPGICGGNARIDGTRIPVWGIERQRQLGYSIKDTLEYYPHLTKEQIWAAREYADQHSVEIMQQILDNET